MRFEYFFTAWFENLICFLFSLFLLSFSVSSIGRGKNRQKQVVTFCGVCLSVVIHRPFKGIILFYKVIDLENFCEDTVP